MASHQRKRNLDKSTRGALSVLEWALQEFGQTDIRADEFTTNDFADKTGKSRNVACYELKKLERDGKLVSRVGKQNGSATRFYRKP